MRLNVLYQFNEKYVPYAGISMVSLMENNKSIKEIFIYVLGENLSPYSREQITQQVQQYGRQIYFIDTKELIGRMQQLGIPKYRDSYATNMKMFVTDYLNADIDRLLYIDSDTIICGNLSSLIFLNMNNKPIAMVLDSLIGESYKKSIGLSKSDHYFNGGIILYDIKKWHQDMCTERILKHVRNIRASYVSPDQDLLNIVLKKQIGKIDISYNLQPIHTVYTYKQYRKIFGEKTYYSENEINSAVDNPKILHAFRYLGEFPWHKNSLHPYKLYFDQYMQLSLWKNYQKQPTDQNGTLFKIERYLYVQLPKTIFLKIFKISHNIYIQNLNKNLIKQEKKKIHSLPQNPTICIYVTGHKPFNMPEMDPIYFPLMVGDQYEELPEGWLSDQTGENISNKNPRYNELTGLYWIWKNSNADIVGLCHYHRFFTTLVGKIKNMLTGMQTGFIDKKHIIKALISYDMILHNKTLTLTGNQNQLRKKNDLGNPVCPKLNIEILNLVDDIFKKIYP